MSNVEKSWSEKDKAQVREALAEPSKPVPERVSIMREGASLTSGDRDQDYGDPMINLACAAELKEVWRKYYARTGRLAHFAELEALDQVMTKLARCATGPKAKRDTYVDGSTYFAIAGEAAISQDRQDRQEDYSQVKVIIKT